MMSCNVLISTFSYGFANDALPITVCPENMKPGVTRLADWKFPGNSTI